MTEPERQRWVYKTTFLAAEITWAGKQRIDACLDELGRDGWELISVLEGSGGSPALFVFKRPFFGTAEGDGEGFENERGDHDRITLDDLDFSGPEQSPGDDSPVDKMIRAAEERMRQRLREN